MTYKGCLTLFISRFLGEVCSCQKILCVYFTKFFDFSVSYLQAVPIAVPIAMAIAVTFANDIGGRRMSPIPGAQSGKGSKTDKIQEKVGRGQLGEVGTW